MEASEFILITGPMFAGKSKYLIDNYEDIENKQVFSPDIDTRSAHIASRSYPDKKMPCTKISTPDKILEQLKSTTEVVVIDEYQFFGPVELLVDTVEELKKQKKQIVMAGLDLLASGAEWKNYTALKSLNPIEIKLTADCQTCGNPAQFTEKVSGDKTKSVQIESNEVTYEPRCVKHFSGGGMSLC